jgi:hypothetical protein
MSEFDAIKKYLEKGSGKVEDISYYTESQVFNAGGSFFIGKQEGISDKKCYFFGNLNLNLEVNIPVVLTNRMELIVILRTYLQGREEYSGIDIPIGVNLGISLLGDGSYAGGKRLYGVGFNNVGLAVGGFGVSTFLLTVNWNGYLFRLK